MKKTKITRRQHLDDDMRAKLKELGFKKVSEDEHYTVFQFDPKPDVMLEIRFRRYDAATLSRWTRKADTLRSYTYPSFVTSAEGLSKAVPFEIARLKKGLPDTQRGRF